MAQIYIDTNIFLDFYQAAIDRLKLFREFVDRADQVILTEQTINEFRRNRAARLSALAKSIEEKAVVHLFTTSVVQELPEFADWVAARDEVKAKAKAIATRLRDWVHNESSDLVLTEFNKLTSAAFRIATTDDAIGRAQKRKMLGNPPTSPDKHTIGDELIWESLLGGCTADLIIVSRDNTFTDNESLLKSEYDSGSRRLVLVTRNLGEALAQVGKPSTEVTKAEEVIEAARRANPADESDRCPECGGRMESTGFEGSDGDEAGWLYCTKCGHEEF